MPATQGHTITTEPALGRRVARTDDGRVLADSTGPLLLHETGAPVRTYFPREDVDWSQLADSDHTTHCPFKGDARYWTVAGVGDVAWSYEQPFEQRTDITGLVAFWDARGVTVTRD